MKIRNILFEIHPILQGLKLDFTNESDSVVNTIIIAGENGVGKSVILNTIFNFTHALWDFHGVGDEKIIYEVEISEDEYTALDFGKKTNKYPKPYNNDKYIIEIDYRVNNWDRYENYYIDDNNNRISMPSNIFFIQNTGVHAFSSVFSEAEINFSPDEINYVTSSNIDQDSSKNIKSSQSLSTQITQLLVDVQSLDALDFSQWARANKDKLIDENQLDVRIKRFTNAFDFMFPNKKYKTIENKNDSKQVLFEENGKIMNISQLSSGEKQIVFRGGFLLKDINKLKGSLIIIDEPEISLHPDWQLKIMSFFKKLFTNDAGVQTSQMVITTHSPFILHNYNRNDDKVIILKKSNSGLVSILEDPKFYSWSSEKLVREAFNISHLYSDSKSIVFVEGETDEKYFKKALEIFGKNNSGIEFNWIGRVNEKGSVEFTGNTALNQAKAFLLANPEQMKNKTVLFYDSDTNVPEETLNKLFIRTMPSNLDNTLFKIGVENLLTISESFDVASFYKTIRSDDKYGGVTIKTSLNKMSLCSHICDELPNEALFVLLQHLNAQIDRLARDIG